MKFSKIAVFLLVAALFCAGAAYAQGVTPELAQDVKEASKTIDLLKNYLILLVSLVTVTIPLTKAVGKWSGWPEDRIGLVMGGILSPMAHLSFEGLQAPVSKTGLAGLVLGIFWAFIFGLCAGALSEVAAQKWNALFPNAIDLAFTKSAGTGDGTTPKPGGGGTDTGGTIPVVLLALGLVATTACIPMRDPTTVTELRSLQSKATAAATCPPMIARLEAQTGPMKDKKSVKHARWICDCFAEADTAAKEETCRDYLEGYVDYETDKDGGVQ